MKALVVLLLVGLSACAEWAPRPEPQKPDENIPLIRKQLDEQTKLIRELRRKLDSMLKNQCVLNYVTPRGGR